MSYAFIVTAVPEKSALTLLLILLLIVIVLLIIMVLVITFENKKLKFQNFGNSSYYLQIPIQTQ